MKLQFISAGILILVSTAYGASVGDWAPSVFNFGTQPALEALTELSARNDKALADVESVSHDFAVKFPTQLARFSSIALNSIVMPLSLPPESTETYADTPDHALAKTIKNLQIFALNNAVEISAPSYPSDRHLTYRYCELQPSDSNCQDSHEYNGLEWALTRRVVSSSRFVQSACPIIEAYTKWDLRWRLQSPQELNSARHVFQEVDRMLSFIYGNGQWTLARLDQFSGSLDENIYRTLVRRYMDGGPEFIKAAQTCLQTVATDLDLLAISSDPQAHAAIDGILQFKSVSASQGVPAIDLQTQVLDQKAIYRLTHGLTSADPTPEMFEPGANPSYGWSNYFARLGGGESYEPFSIDIDQWRRLVMKLSEFDATSSYRSLNRAEFTALIKAGKLAKNFTHVCLLENGGAYSGNPDGTIEADPAYICHAGEMLMVREPKLTKAEGLDFEKKL